MLKVAVAGAQGRMGRLAVQTLQTADDLEYVGGFARSADNAARIYFDFPKLLAEQKPDVVVDFTTHPITVDIAMQCVTKGISPVIGATGWTDTERNALAESARKNNVGAMLVPNFALGAVLMMRFAEQAARFFPTAEIIELHHDKKVDKPSGTAKLTADRMKTASGQDVPIQSVRLRGLVAHQEVLLSNTGELLTIRHDSLSRESFATGILFAVRAVREHAGLTVGLDSLINERLK